MTTESSPVRGNHVHITFKLSPLRTTWNHPSLLHWEWEAELRGVRRVVVLRSIKNDWIILLTVDLSLGPPPQQIRSCLGRKGHVAILENSAIWRHTNVNNTRVLYTGYSYHMSDDSGVWRWAEWCFNGKNLPTVSRVIANDVLLLRIPPRLPHQFPRD